MKISVAGLDSSESESNSKEEQLAATCKEPRKNTKCANCLVSELENELKGKRHLHAVWSHSTVAPFVVRLCVVCATCLSACVYHVCIMCVVCPLVVLAAHV